MQLINRTPHALTIMDADGKRTILTLGATAPALRVAVVREGTAHPLGNHQPPIQVHQVRFGKLLDAPEGCSDVFYVVSRMVKDAAPWRTDFLVPGDLVRAPDGTPIGCRGLDL